MGARCGRTSSNADSEPPSDAQPAFHASLAPLSSLRTLYIRQDLPHDLRLCCAGNSFALSDEGGKERLTAQERPLCNACCARWWCGPARGFRLDVAGPGGAVLVAERAACRCDWWCCLDCCCCAHRALVFDAEGAPVGRVRQRFACGSPLLHVEDETGRMVAKVRGPGCPCRCCCDQIFNVFVERAGRWRQDGRIVKMWSDEVVEEQPQGKTRRFNMDHELAQVIFAEDSEVIEKALLLGATFLIDYMYFEMS